jgi:CHAD domain-containing protein
VGNGGTVISMRATVEHERKLDAPAGFRLPPLGGRPLESRLFTSVYYDVPGASLAAAGITLRRRVEHGRGVWQLKLPSEDARLELEAEGGPVGPPDELLRLLRAHLRHGPLEPVAELRTRRSGELVARDGTTAEVTVDEVAVMDARRVRDEFVEVELELRTGSPGHLDVLARELVEAGAQPGEGQPKLFRVLRRGTNGPLLPATPFETLRGLLRTQLGEIEAHDPGTRLGRDPESLHDMRVAVRRFRALLHAGRKLLATDTAQLDARLKELGGVLGEVRDLDVLLAHLEPEAASFEGEDAGAARALLGALGRERSGKRDRLLATLDSEAYLALLDELGEMLDTLEPSKKEVPLDALARRAAQKTSKLARTLPDDPADEQLHALRKAGKRARYAAELAGREKVVQRAKRLQDVLGAHQDAVVAMQRLRELAARAPAQQAFAAGRLAEREEAQRAEARAAWPKAWKKLRQAI